MHRMLHREERLMAKGLTLEGFSLWCVYVYVHVLIHMYVEVRG